MKEAPLRFELTQEQPDRYYEWARATAVEDDLCATVTVCFVLTPIGREIMAYRGYEEPRTSRKIVLEEL